MPDESRMTVTLPKLEYDKLVKLANFNTPESRRDMALKLVETMAQLFERRGEANMAYFLRDQGNKIAEALAQ